MDSSLIILVPEVPRISGLVYKVNVRMWAGVEYPQLPGRWVWGPHVEFAEDRITDFYVRSLPPGCISQDWRALCLGVGTLDLLFNEVNGSEVDWGGRNIVDAIRCILSASANWVVVFWLHDDQIDQLYEMDVEKCIEHLQHNLRLEAWREGFMVISSRPASSSSDIPKLLPRPINWKR